MQALSRRNDDPATASRPYDVGRDGFVLGEGAARARRRDRGARQGPRRPHLRRAARRRGHERRVPHHGARPRGLGRRPRHDVGALESAGATLDDVTHINAHATSTPVGDIAEYNALRRVFGDRLDGIAVSATKASTGHLLGGAGAIEAMFTVLALHERIAPPTINLTEQDPEIPLDVVTSPRALGDGELVAISNSFGFGGHNAVVAFRTRLSRAAARTRRT